MIDLDIQVLDKSHDRHSFYCGEESLDHYFKQFATQDIKRNISRIFVATNSLTNILQNGNKKRVLGFYSLSANSLNSSELPDNFRKKLPKYPVPVSLLGRLAVNKDFQHQGVGKVLLADALKRVYSASTVMAVYALVVEALDDRAKNYYEKFGFIALPNKKLTLFLPLQLIKELIKS